MPADGGNKIASVVDTPGDQSSARHDRPALTAFIADARSEEALRDGLIDFASGEIDIRRGGIRSAIAAMQKQATPKVLIVDVSGEDQPLTRFGRFVARGRT